MKKVLLVFTLVSLMVFTLSFSALGAGQVYFDYIANGEWDDVDLSGFVVGGEYKTDTFKVGLDYLIGEINDEADYTQYVLKGGYGINENIFITLSMFDGTAEYTAPSYKFSMSGTGFMLGADLSYDFSDKFTFEGSFGISIDGELEESETGYEDVTVDADFTILKLKLIYNVSDKIGVSFGYNTISLEPDSSSDSLDLNYTTLGASYKF